MPHGTFDNRTVGTHTYLFHLLFSLWRWQHELQAQRHTVPLPARNKHEPSLPYTFKRDKASGSKTPKTPRCAAIGTCHLEDKPPALSRRRPRHGPRHPLPGSSDNTRASNGNITLLHRYD